MNDVLSLKMPLQTNAIEVVRVRACVCLCVCVDLLIIRIYKGFSEMAVVLKHSKS